MTFKTLLKNTSALVIAGSLALPATAAMAQDQNDEGAIEEVVVTGSHIRRRSQLDSPSPITVIGSEDLAAIGAKTIADITQTLTINTGAQNNPDAFTQNFSTGTTNINLRGLGVASTLVLLNGKRQVTSGAVTDQGLGFVDTSSLIPMIAIDRLEIVKDGASATYGSDAVAGVANFITRNNFEGLEISADYQSAAGGDQKDIRVQAIVGAGNDRTHVMAAFGWMDRTPLTTAEKRLPGSLDPLLGDFSNAGNPGTFILPVAPGPGADPLIQALWFGVFDANGLVPGFADVFEPTLGLPAVPGALTPAFADPQCGQSAIGVPPPGIPAFGIPDGIIGLCRLDFGKFFNLVPEESRIQSYASVTHEINDSIEFYGEFAFSRNRAQRGNTPSFPFLAPVPIPDPNPFIQAVYDTTSVLWVGRPVGDGAPFNSTHDSNTYRAQAGLRGDFNDSWFWDFSYTRAQNDFELTAGDTLANQFDLALAGLGGPRCNPSTGLAGQGDCMFFNPFGSGTFASPTDTVPFDTLDAGGNPITIQVPLFNSQELIDSIIARLIRDAQSDLTVVDGVVSGDLMELPGGTVGVAVGFQYREEHYSLNADDQSNNDNFKFTLGQADFGATRDIVAVFGEVALPIMTTLDLQLALRYEDYGAGIGDTLDPKIAILWRPMEGLTLRGSFSTAFRAPTIFQSTAAENGDLIPVQTTLGQLVDPLVGQPKTPAFKAIRTFGNAALKPEESTSWNIGFSWEPAPNLELGVDYWRFDFTDVIIRESAQAILTADPCDDRVVRTGSVPDPTNPDLSTNPTCDALTGAGGSLIRVLSNFDNAAGVETDGIDISAAYTQETNSYGTIRVGVEATYILNYDLVDPQAGNIDGAGNRNFTNFGNPTPEWRINGNVAWALGAHSANVFVRYIDGYNDDQFFLNADSTQSENGRVASHTTVDIQYNLDLSEVLGIENGAVITIGSINVFDQDPPQVQTNGGFDSKVHDPRGRLIYLRGTLGF